MHVKKKNLYKKYIACKSTRTQRKGKQNKLTNILRIAEKDHYSKLLRKHDIKGFCFIWHARPFTAAIHYIHT